MSWTDDKAWSDRFLREIKRILGEHLIGEPPMEEDAERNTDLIVMKMDAARIGCRVRKHQYLSRYGGEFTIRSGRPSGAKTELTKIIEGWGDYFFYGFADADEQCLRKWFVGDLNVFRLWFNRHIATHGGRSPGMRQKNGDCSSEFLAFAVRDIPKEFIVGQSRF